MALFGKIGKVQKFYKIRLKLYLEEITYEQFKRLG